MEALSANGVDDMDGSNIVSGGCIYRWGCQPTHPPSRLPHFLLPWIGCILTIMADTSGLMDGSDDINDSQTKCTQCSSPITCKISMTIQWMSPNAPEVVLTID